MKTITKNLNHVIKVITFALVLLISFNVSAQKTKYSEKEISDIRIKLKKTMNSFVENVKPYYQKGMTYNEFKIKILDKGSSNITNDGNALLNKAFIYLSNSATSKQVINSDSGMEMAKALVYVYNYNSKKKSSDGELILFGDTTGGTSPFGNNIVLKKDYPCRWYQIRCHLGQLFGVEVAQALIEALAEGVLLIIFP